MTVTMCPGQNTAFWGPGDIFEIVCPACGAKVEFFKDDAQRRCLKCGHIFANPKLNEGCAKWCQYADKCLGLNPEIHPQTPDPALSGRRERPESSAGKLPEPAGRKPESAG